jgi:hypothetical protein
MRNDMSESTNAEIKNTPWHLWVVGIVGLAWSAMGAFDYVMSQTKNEAYMGQFTPEQLDFFYGLPSWAIATWALAVWGGVVGAIFLLLKKRVAVWIFLVSLVCMVITSFQNYILSNGMEVMGDAFSLSFSALIFITSLGLYLYSKAMSSKGILT